MRFCEILNAFIARLGCMAKDICEKSGISAATLSRYRSGERLPVLNSGSFEKLCLALAEIAKEKAESEFEMYRVIQDRTFKSDFDLFSEEIEKLEKK